MGNIVSNLEGIAFLGILGGAAFLAYKIYSMGWLGFISWIKDLLGLTASKVGNVALGAASDAAVAVAQAADKISPGSSAAMSSRAQGYADYWRKLTGQHVTPKAEKLGPPITDKVPRTQGTTCASILNAAQQQYHQLKAAQAKSAAEWNRVHPKNPIKDLSSTPQLNPSWLNLSRAPAECSSKEWKWTW